MFFSTLLTFAVALGSFAAAEDALGSGPHIHEPVFNVTNVPYPRTLFWASLSRNRFDPFFGSVNFTVPFPGSTDGVGILRGVQMLDASEGPFSITVNQNAIPTGGSCDLAGDVFDPPRRSHDERPAGDISGRYEPLPSFRGALSTYAGNMDHRLSVNPSDPAFVGGRSVVLTNGAGIRVACGTIIEKVVVNGRDGRCTQIDCDDIMWEPLPSMVEKRTRKMNPATTRPREVKTSTRPCATTMVKRTRYVHTSTMSTTRPREVETKPTETSTHIPYEITDIPFPATTEIPHGTSLP